MQTAPAEVFGATPLFPRYIDAVVLGAGTAESYAVPAGAAYAIITSDGAFFARLTGTAVIPTTEVSDGTASMYIPAGIQIRVEGGTTISMIRAAASSTIITIALYSTR